MDFIKKRSKWYHLFVLIVILNLMIAFKMVFKDVNLKIVIKKPSFLVLNNKDNYFISSNYSEVISDIDFYLDEPIEINVETENNLIAIPLYFLKTKDFDLENYNLTIDFYSSIKNTSNLFEVYYVKTNKVSCKSGTKLGKILTTSGERVLCYLEKINESSPQDEFIGKLNIELEETKNYNETKFIVLKVNPFYKGEIDLKFIMSIFRVSE